MKKTRILSLLLALVMLLSTLSIGMTVYADTAYSDVNEGMWSYLTSCTFPKTVS